MSELANNLQRLQQRIAAACARAGREPASVQLVAVSKSVDAERLLDAATAGQTCFGESYLQEALPKIARLAQSTDKMLDWHFIGPIQANKTAAIAQNFHWVHSVDREKIARRLSEARSNTQAALEVCVQVNVSGEANKSGCAPDQALALCAAVSQLPKLQLRGLMTIPAPSADLETARASFRELRELAEHIRASGRVAAAQFDTLSMGMSDDFEIAIEEGATLVRIGSTLFGARPQSSSAKPSR